MSKFKIKNISPPYQPIDQAEKELLFNAASHLDALDFKGDKKIQHIHKFYISALAWSQITQHIAWGQTTSFNTVEQGGLLLGQVYRDEDKRILYGLAEEAVVGDLAKGTPAYLRMDFETWKKMIDEIDEKDQSTQVIGWYHTHPNSLDVFMSGTDMRTQRRMFSLEWQFAIVINPHRQIWRAFRGANAEKCIGKIAE